MQSMTRISDLPSPLRDAPGLDALVLFDGECVMCSWFFQFMLARDTGERFNFATAQSELGQALYRALGLPTDRFETYLVIVDGVIYQRLDAFAAAMGALGHPWRLLSVARVLPRPVKDGLYGLIARNRYRMFGRRDSCLIPTPELRARFLDMPPAT